MGGLTPDEIDFWVRTAIYSVIFWLVVALGAVVAAIYGVYRLVSWLFS